MKSSVKKSNLLSKKIMLGVFAFVVVAVAVFFIVYGLSLRTNYYECSVYQTSVKTTGDPLVTDEKELYEYYQIYLFKDKTFKLVYKFKDEKESKTYRGFYSYLNENKVLALDYQGSGQDINYAMEMDGLVYYRIYNNKLVRIKSATDMTEGSFSETYRYTVYQEFVNKVKW